jgi:fatty acid synthase, animal type
MTVVAMENEAGERPIQPVPEFVCDEGGVYVITGGLGGFGLALAAWLVQRGASRLLLSSKRGLRTGGQARALDALARQGAQVEHSGHVKCFLSASGLK